MASAIVGALRVVLSLDSAEFNTEMKRVSGVAKTWSTDLTTMGRQATALGSSLTRGLTLPIAGLGIAAVKAASDFESSFAGVRKTVDATEPEFAQLAQGLRDMAKEIPVSVNELNKVAESAGQLGIKKDDILTFTRTMADLGVTTNLTADQAATATAQMQNIFGTAGKDVDRFGSTLVALGNSGASTEKDIIEMGLRIAGAGNQIGLTQAQVLSFANGLASVGINAEAGGSAISRTFLKINDAVARGGADMAEFARVAGMSAADFKKSFEKDAASATVAFIEGLKRIKGEGENVNATLEGLVGKNIIIKDTLLRASGAGELLRESLKLGNKAWEENTALTKEAAERYKTFASQMTILWNQVRDVAITLGTALLPVMKDMLGLLTPLVGMMSGLADIFAKLPEPVRMVAVGFAALVAAVGPALWIFGQIATNVGTVIGAFKSKGLAMVAITKAYGVLAPWLVAISGSFAVIGALAVTMAAALYGVGKAFVDLYNHWQDGGSMWEFFSARDEDNFVRRGLKWIGVLDGTKKAVRDTNIELSEAGDAAAAFVGPMNQTAEAAAKTDEELKAATASAKAFASALRSFGGQDALAGAQEVIKQLGALGGPMNVLPAKLGEMAEKLREGAQAALMMGKAGLADQYTKLAASLSPMVLFQQRYNVTLGDYQTGAAAATMQTEEMWEQFFRLSGQVQKFGPVLKSSMILPLTQFKDAVVAVGPAAEKSFENIANAVQNIGTTILQAIQGGGNVLSSVGASIGMSIGKDLQTNLAGFLTRNLGKTIGDAVGTMLPGIGALLGPALSLLGSGLKKAFGIGINEEVRKANVEIEKTRQHLIDTHGPLDQLEAKANAVGLSFAANWAHQGKAGQEAFNKLITEFDRRWAELDAKRAKLEGDLKTTQGELDGLIGKGRELGYEFGASGEFIGVTFDAVKAKANEFGVSVDGLGPKFRQQGIDAEAGKIINAFTLLEKAGGDVGGILVGMKDEIGKVVGDSIKFGTTIPKNMEPWVKELMRTNQLTDENGVAITDLSKLKFGEPVKTEFEKISSALLLVVEKLGEILSQIAAIPTQRTLTVQAVYNDPGPPPGFGDPGGGGGDNNSPGFAIGTLGKTGSWFKDFGRSFNTNLHGLEAVITPQQAPAFAMDVMSGMGGAAAAGGGDNGALLSEIQGLRRDLNSTIPAIAETAARHGAQTSGRRR